MEASKHLFLQSAEQSHHACTVVVINREAKREGNVEGIVSGLQWRRRGTNILLDQKVLDRRHQIWNARLENALAENRTLFSPVEFESFGLKQNLTTSSFIRVHQKRALFHPRMTDSGLMRTNRVIGNHDALVSSLQQSLRPNCSVVEQDEGLPLYKQLELFWHARAVVGPHGAAFSLMLACQENTMILEFLNGRGEVNLSFLRLALILKHRYFGRVVGDATHGGMSLMWLPPQTISEAARLVADQLFKND